MFLSPIGGFIAILVENSPKASRKIGSLRPVSGEA